jgi:hypothetical protein
LRGREKFFKVVPLDMIMSLGRVETEVSSGSSYFSHLLPIKNGL